MRRFCIYCGKLTESKKQNLLVCELGHENWLNPATAVAACVLRGNEMLFGTRQIEPRNGGLTIPGGFLELGESFERAILREVKEEAGIEGKIIAYLGSYAVDYDDIEKPVVVPVFVLEIAHGTVTPADDLGGEAIWRSLDDLPKKEELSWEWQADMFKDLLAWRQTQRNG